MRDSPLSRGAIAAIVGALRLADLQGFDPQPDNFVATGSFCFAPPGMAPQQVRVPSGRFRASLLTACPPTPSLPPRPRRRSTHLSVVLLCARLANTLV